MRRKKSEQGDKPSENVGLKARAKGFPARGQAPSRESSDDLHRGDPAGTPISSVRREVGKEPIQEGGKVTSLSSSSSSPPARVLITDDHPFSETR